ncbi:MAG: nuclear transport factor 2 family protein [Phycisphaerales bacterium]|nr:MAG: nuclear transport factor 2 family protein [Phycisphaerales bacterium]
MKIFKGVVHVCVISLLLYSVLIVLRHQHKALYDAKDTYVFSKGNAPEDVREEIIQQLHKFQDGYTNRDLSALQPFMEDLFSQENILILGTQPRETLHDYEHATALVRSDWRRWGDCTFLMDQSHVSTSGNVAWISTAGYIEFDMSRFLVLPLRLSAVVVKESDVWKFQHMQFQFDLDVTSLLVIIVVLLIWLPISVVSLALVIIKSVRRPRTEVEST